MLLAREASNNDALAQSLQKLWATLSPLSSRLDWLESQLNALRTPEESEEYQKTTEEPAHNELAGLQGGLSGEYYHFSQSEHNRLQGLMLGSTPWKLKAPDGSPDPAFSVDNDGNLIIATDGAWLGILSSTEHISNGSFETGDVTGWTGNALAVVNTFPAQDGTYYARCADGAYIWQTISLVSGRTYSLSFWVQTGSGFQVQGSVQLYSGDTLVSSITTWTTSTAAWENFTATFVAPGTGDYRIRFTDTSSFGPPYLSRIDNVSVTGLSNGGRLSFKSGSPDLLSFLSCRLGVGIATPDSTLHVWGASAGTVTSATDLFTIEDDTSNGMSILTPATATGQIFFGDPDDNDVGGITYDHSTNTMALRASTIDSMHITSTLINNRVKAKFRSPYAAEGSFAERYIEIGGVNVNTIRSYGAPSGGANLSLLADNSWVVLQGSTYVNASGMVGINTTTSGTNQYLLKIKDSGSFGTVGILGLNKNHATDSMVIGFCREDTVKFTMNMEGAASDFAMKAGSNYGLFYDISENNFAIGGNTTTARLHLPAGTATASTAPLKFTSGTSLTTAEAGAVEFTTDDLFFTITTGAARKGIVLNDGTPLASGSLAVATTNGRIETTAGTVPVVGDLLVGAAGPSWSKLANVAVGSMLFSTGVGTALAWNTTGSLSGNLMIGAASAAASLLEVYSAAASPIITITGLHATDYDPTISFRTDSPATVKAQICVDSTNDYLYITTGATAIANHFVMRAAAGNFADGDVGLGTTATASRLEIAHTPLNLSNCHGVQVTLTPTLTGGVSAVYNHAAMYFGLTTAFAAGTTDTTGIVAGIIGSAYHGSAGTCGGQITAAFLQYGNTSTGNTTGWARGMYIRGTYSAGSTITNLADIYLETPNTGGTVTNHWCVYSAHAAPSRFVDDIRIAADSKYFKCGAADDASIGYDGTYGIINTSLVAPSDLRITCGANKTIELQNSVYDDANVGGVLLSPSPGLAPGQDEFVDDDGDDTGISTYAVAIGEALDGSIEFPHTYKEGTNITFHIHFQIIGAPAGGTDNVKWQLTYAIGKSAALADSVVIVKEIAVTTQYAFYRVDFDAITGTDFDIGDQFLFNIERIAASSDDYAGDCLLATVGFHHEIDTMGSRQIITK